MEVPLSCMELVTWTTTVSPQSLRDKSKSVTESRNVGGGRWEVGVIAYAMMVGPGIVPLTAKTILSTPSGAAVVLTMLNQYSRVTPVSGTSS